MQISYLREVVRKFSSLLFPPKCPGCDEVTGSFIDGDLCETCREKFANSFTLICPRCGNKPAACKCVPDIMGNESDRSPYTKITSPIFEGYYTGYDKDNLVSVLVFKMKRRQNSGAEVIFARIIAHSLSRSFAIQKLDFSEFTVTCIPRSKDSFDEYGFDHMKSVARRVAEMLDCKFESLFLRNGGTAQKNLGAKARTENARNSLALDPKKKKLVQGAKIIVLDDIITTGSSMKAAISILSLAGSDTLIPASAMISKKKDI